MGVPAARARLEGGSFHKPVAAGDVIDALKTGLLPLKKEEGKKLHHSMKLKMKDYLSSYTQVNISYTRGDYSVGENIIRVE